jgi:hypothetical protein
MQGALPKEEEEGMRQRLCCSRGMHFNLSNAFIHISAFLGHYLYKLVQPQLDFCEF